MPVINVKMTHQDGGATKEQKRSYIKGITELFAKFLMVEVQRVCCYYSRSEY